MNTYKVGHHGVVIARGLGGVGNAGVDVDTAGTEESVVLVVCCHFDQKCKWIDKRAEFVSGEGVVAKVESVSRKTRRFIGRMRHDAMGTQRSSYQKLWCVAVE